MAPGYRTPGTRVYTCTAVPVRGYVYSSRVPTIGTGYAGTARIAWWLQCRYARGYGTRALASATRCATRTKRSARARARRPRSHTRIGRGHLKRNAGAGGPSPPSRGSRPPDGAAAAGSARSQSKFVCSKSGHSEPEDQPRRHVHREARLRRRDDGERLRAQSAVGMRPLRWKKAAPASSRWVLCGSSIGLVQCGGSTVLLPVLPQLEAHNRRLLRRPDNP